MDFALWSKTEGLTQTGPNLDRDRSGPFSGTDGLGSVRSTDLRSVFGHPYFNPSMDAEMKEEEDGIKRNEWISVYRSQFD